MPSKTQDPWLSKTYGLALLVALAGVLQYLTESPLMADHPKALAWVCFALASLIAIIRAVTTKPLTPLADIRKRFNKSRKT